MSWVWAPVTGGVVRGQYPGVRYVDIVGLSGFIGGTVLNWGGWRTFTDAFDAPMHELRQIAPDKPVQISEVGTAKEGGSKPLWIKEMFDYVIAHPDINAVLWFDLPKQTDWRVATSRSATRAFAEGVSRMQGTTTPVPVPAPALSSRRPR